MTALALLGQADAPPWATGTPAWLELLRRADVDAQRTEHARRADSDLIELILEGGPTWWRHRTDLLPRLLARLNDPERDPLLDELLCRCACTLVDDALHPLLIRDEDARETLGVTAASPRRQVARSAAAAVRERLRGAGWARRELDELAAEICERELRHRLHLSAVARAGRAAAHLGPLARKLTRGEWRQVSDLAFDLAGTYTGWIHVPQLARNLAAQTPLWAAGRGRP